MSEKTSDRAGQATNSQSPIAKGPSTIETVLGNSLLKAHFRDGSEKEVEIAQLGVGQFYAMLSAQGSDMALIILYSGMTEAQVNGLVPASQEAILNEGERLNADFFGRSLQRLKDRVGRIRPGAMERFFETEPVRPSTSPSGSPKLPSSAG